MCVSVWGACVCECVKEKEMYEIERVIDAKLQIEFFCDSRNKFQSEGWTKSSLFDKYKERLPPIVINKCLLFCIWYGNTEKMFILITLLKWCFKYLPRCVNVYMLVCLCVCLFAFVCVCVCVSTLFPRRNMSSHLHPVSDFRIAD